MKWKRLTTRKQSDSSRPVDEDAKESQNKNSRGRWSWKRSPSLDDETTAASSLDIARHRDVSISSLLLSQQSLSLEVNIDDTHHSSIVSMLEEHDAIGEDIGDGSNSNSNDENICLIDISSKEDHNEAIEGVSVHEESETSEQLEIVASNKTEFDAQESCSSSSPQQQPQEATKTKEHQHENHQRHSILKKRPAAASLFDDEAEEVDSKCSEDHSMDDDSILLGHDSINGSSVSFGAVEIHQHSLELASSSVPLRGPPLGLGWERTSYQRFETVDEHSEDLAEGRTMRQLLLSPRERVNTLLSCGYTLREIRAATRDTGVAHTNRLRSSRFSARPKFLQKVFVFGSGNL